MSERKRGGSKLSRSETVSVRLDPRLRLAAELAAGKERRSLSSFVEWCVEQQTKEVLLVTKNEFDYSSGEINITDKSAYDVSIDIWEPEYADSFVRRSIFYEKLLTVEELVAWRIIQDAPYLWTVYYDHDAKRWKWLTNTFNKIDKFELRKIWPTILAAASGDEAAEKTLNDRRESFLGSLQIPLPHPTINKTDNLDEPPF